MNKKDTVTPQGKWEFNESVANCFDDMLNRSIPNYKEMRLLTKLIVDKYKTNFCFNEPMSLLDIGCSNGLNIELFVNENMQCYGIDVSEPMINKARKKFIDCNNVHILNYDIRKGISQIGENFNIITSILTLQFIPMEHRQDVLYDIYKSLSANGLFILVEKTLGINAPINKLLVDSYYTIKKQNGYSYDAIDRKKKSLEGVLVPCTSNWNKDLLQQAGFNYVETFWKYLNFEGVLAVKGGFLN